MDLVLCELDAALRALAVARAIAFRDAFFAEGMEAFGEDHFFVASRTHRAHHFFLPETPTHLERRVLHLNQLVLAQRFAPIIPSRFHDFRAREPSKRRSRFRLLNYALLPLHFSSTAPLASITSNSANLSHSSVSSLSDSAAHGSPTPPPACCFHSLSLFAARTPFSMISLNFHSAPVRSLTSAQAPSSPVSNVISLAAIFHFFALVNYTEDPHFLGISPPLLGP